jgi:hypothetical protein
VEKEGGSGIVAGVALVEITELLPLSLTARNLILYALPLVKPVIVKDLSVVLGKGK